MLSESEERITEKQIKIMETVDQANFDIERINKKLNQMSMKDDELNENIIVAFKKIAEVNSKNTELETTQASNLTKIEGRINPINRLISNIQLSLSETGEKISQLEKDIDEHRDNIIDLENSISKIARMREEESKKRQAVKKEDEAIIVKESSDSFDPSIIEEFKKEVMALSAGIMKSAKETEESLKREVSESIKKLNEQVQSIKKENEESFKEVNEKLNWLPVNVNQMSNMTPNEARLFTLEARLRSEENSRIKAFNFLSKILESQRISKELSMYQDLLTIREKRDTPEGIYTAEMLKKLGENDRKSCDYREGYSNLMDAKHEEEGIDLRNKHRTPRSKEITPDFFGREARTSSVMGRRIMRKGY